MRTWRIVKEKYAKYAFDGQGARQNGGRWNHVGVAVVFTSESISLAAMEMLIHLEEEEVLKHYIMIPVDFPRHLCRTLAKNKLPKNWKEYPPPQETRDIGSNWVIRSESAVLKVPSVLVEEEYNYLLNPMHPDFSKLKIGKPQPFSFDPQFGRKK